MISWKKENVNESFDLKIHIFNGGITCQFFIGALIAIDVCRWVSVTQFVWNKAIEWSKETGKSVLDFEL